MTKAQLREAFILRQRAYLASDPKEGDDTILKAAIMFYDFGVEDAEKAMIDKACEWLTKNYGHHDGRVEDFVSDFKKVMKGE